MMKLYQYLPGAAYFLEDLLGSMAFLFSRWTHHKYTSSIGCSKNASLIDIRGQVSKIENIQCVMSNGATFTKSQKSLWRENKRMSKLWKRGMESAGLPWFTWASLYDLAPQHMKYPFF